MICRIKTKIPWKVFQDNSTGHWVGTCDVLELTATGTTFKFLLEMIFDIQEDMFHEMHHENHIAFIEFLKERDIEFEDINWGDVYAWDIPVELVELDRKLVRNTLTPEKKGWWEAVRAAAKAAPKLTYER
jgi:hypothetical protein